MSPNFTKQSSVSWF